MVVSRRASEGFVLGRLGPCTCLFFHVWGLLPRLANMNHAFALAYNTMIAGRSTLLVSEDAGTNAGTAVVLAVCDGGLGRLFAQTVTGGCPRYMDARGTNVTTPISIHTFMPILFPCV